MPACLSTRPLRRRAGLFLCVLALLIGCRSEAPSPVPPVNPAWERQESGTTERLQAVSIVSAEVVWASGTGGTYALTTDGGTTWRSGVVPGADTLQFRDVHGVDARTAYLLAAGPGAASRIYKTTDGGASWTLQFTNPEPDGFFDCFDFWDATHGIAFSDALDGRHYLIATEDGTTWHRLPPEALPEALPGEGAFAASGTCVVTHPGGHVWVGTGASTVAARVLHSADYGRTWAVAETPLVHDTPASGIYTLAFLDVRHGMALGGDYTRSDSLLTRTAARTRDGGRTWSLAGAPPLRGAVFGAAYVPGLPTPTLIAVGPDGSALSTDDGQTWTRFDDASYWSVAARGPEATWAVGPDGRLARLRLR
ncbi:MAG: oxidoreductase [Rhodothermaceae bacterium]|nr:MAG: oxidoreductase [Rhodothermaceae bacterium]